MDLEEKEFLFFHHFLLFPKGNKENVGISDCRNVRIRGYFSGRCEKHPKLQLIG
jgi:hypothetical protein